MKKVCLVISFLAILSTTAWSQPKWEVNLSGGGMNYMGDLVKPAIPYLKATKPAFGFGLTYLPRPSIAFSLQGLNGSITGSDQNVDDKSFKERSFSFETQITEVGLTMRWEPFAKKRYPSLGIYKRIISPYIFLGGAITKIDAKPDFSNADRETWVERIHKDLGKVKPTVDFTLPIGGGLRLDLGKRTAVDFQVGVRKTFTDYLDGISETANPTAKDWYMTGLVRFVIRLGDKDTDKDGIADSEDYCPQVAGAISSRGCPDADGDGVEDLEDLCPYKAGPLHLNGCPDFDLDGVADLEDDCPKVKGSIFTAGCPDKDGDGFRDTEDRCPNEAGTKLLNGCPDCDGDGLKDAIDKCPKESGSFETDGCPLEDIDSDGDGFADIEDKCPKEKGVLGGCPDKDGDKVADWKDKCPEVFGNKNNEGCPELSKNEKEVLEFAMKAVKFETGSDILLLESVDILNKVVNILKAYPHYNLDIEGHTDSQGDEVANQKLSEQRAAACNNFFKKQGIDEKRMHYKGFGEKKPITSNETLAGRKLNRRVEFILNID